MTGNQTRRRIAGLHLRSESSACSGVGKRNTEEGETMSGNIGGQARALPFTGFATLPIIAIGIILSCFGWLMTRIRPKHDNA